MTKAEQARARVVGRALKEGYIKIKMKEHSWDRKRAVQEWVQQKREAL